MRITLITTLALLHVALAAPGTVRAQEAPQPLTLQECIDAALQHNLDRLSAFQDLLSTRAQLAQARAPFGLQVDADFDLPTYSEFRDLQESVALANRVREERTDFAYTGQLMASQRLRHLGRLVVYTSAERRDVTSNTRADYLDVVGDVRASYSHELLHTPGEEVALKRAELGLVSARHAYDSNKLYLEGQVIEAYYALVQAIRQLEIEEQRLEQSTANLELAQRKFEIGLIAEVEALNLRVTKLQSEASFAQARTDIERRRDALRDVMGLDLDAPLEVVTQVEFQRYAVDSERALRVALENRTDMQRAEITRQVRRLSLADTRRRNGINATVNASISLRGRGDELEDISRNLGRNQWGAGLTVTMPLLDSGERSGQLRQAEVAVEQADLSREQTRRNVIRDVRDAVRNVAEAERQISLRQAALEVAERRYQVELSRFELGLAQSQDLLDAQAALTQTRVSALDAVITYQRQLKNLRLATMADLTAVASPEAAE